MCESCHYTGYNPALAVAKVILENEKGIWRGDEMKWLVGIGKRIRDRFNERDWEDFWENTFPIVFLLVAISPFVIVCILHATGLLYDGKPKPKDDCVKVYSVRGEAHEYLMNGNQITHLPNCKYCKGETK